MFDVLELCHLASRISISCDLHDEPESFKLNAGLVNTNHVEDLLGLEFGTELLYKPAQILAEQANFGMVKRDDTNFLCTFAAHKPAQLADEWDELYDTWHELFMEAYDLTEKGRELVHKGCLLVEESVKLTTESDKLADEGSWRIQKADKLASRGRGLQYHRWLLSKKGHKLTAKADRLMEKANKLLDEGLELESKGLELAEKWRKFAGKFHEIERWIRKQWKSLYLKDFDHQRPKNFGCLYLRDSWFQAEDNGDQFPSWGWDKIFGMTKIYRRLGLFYHSRSVKRVTRRKRSWKTMGLGSADIGESCGNGLSQKLKPSNAIRLQTIRWI